MDPLRVMLVDDARLVRAGIARLLADEGVHVIAELSDATGLLPAVRADHPDAVIIDVRMPPTNTTEGLQAAVCRVPKNVVWLDELTNLIDAAALLCDPDRLAACQRALRWPDQLAAPTRTGAGRARRTSLPTERVADGRSP